MMRLRYASWICLPFLLVCSTASTTQAQDFPASGDQIKSRVRETIHPAHVTRRSDGVWFIDFGRDAFAQLELDLAPLQNIPPGSKITIALGEKLTDADHVDRKPGGSVRFLETDVMTEAGKSVYRPKLTAKDERQMPPGIGALMPFRYAELGSLPDELKSEAAIAQAVRQIAVHYPFDDSAADFSCSDQKLNEIWQLCKYSMKATSYAGVFVDGDRERKPYEADAYINQLGWYYCTDDTTLPRHSHEYLITHPTWPTEWIMFSVLTGWNDYLYTGDPASLKAFYNDLKAKTLRGLEREDGLISTVAPAVPAAVSQSVHLREKMRDIVDWPAGERDGYQMLPVNTVVNAFHCRSLALLAKIAAAMGNAQDAADFHNAADRSLGSFNSKLFDRDTGLYVDGDGSHHSSLHANMFPLAFGLVPAERQKKVAAFVQSRGMACSVYGAQFLMDALFDNGRSADAVRLMEASGERSWRHMAEDVGTTITLEAWDTRFKPNQDWNHAWGAAPANLLPRMILGVEPLEPGYRKVLIWPRCAGQTAAHILTWARGRVPTVKGPVSVEWKQSEGGFHLSLDLPKDADAMVRLPADWGDRVQLDGKSATVATGDGTIDLQVATSGKHEIAVGQ